MALLSVESLGQLSRLRIRSRGVFLGKFKGERLSLNRGVGIEFSDYRVYEIGDDLRYVDWKVYARLNRLFVKLFQAEEDLPIKILLDNSKSMGFGQPTKLMCAKQVAAALGYIGLGGLNRVSIYAFSDRMCPVVSPTYGKSQFSKMSKSLQAIDIAGKTDMGSCLTHFITHTRQSGVAVIISDFLDMKDYDPWIKQLVARGFDLTLIHLLADAEIEPQFSGEWRLEDSETGHCKEITINERTIAHYRQRLDIFCKHLRKFCVNRGANYVRITNQTTIEELIFQNLRGIGFFC